MTIAGPAPGPGVVWPSLAERPLHHDHGDPRDASEHVPAERRLQALLVLPSAAPRSAHAARAGMLRGTRDGSDERLRAAPYRLNILGASARDG